MLDRNYAVCEPGTAVGAHQRPYKHLRKVEIQGLTDNRGSARRNKRLSQQRADEAREYLKVCQSQTTFPGTLRQSFRPEKAGVLAGRTSSVGLRPLDPVGFRFMRF